MYAGFPLLLYERYQDGAAVLLVSIDRQLLAVTGRSIFGYDRPVYDSQIKLPRKTLRI